MQLAVATAARTYLEQEFVRATAGMSDDATRDFVGDVGEVALRLIKELDGHQVIQASDRHAPRPNHQLPNDLVSISDTSVLLVHDSKASRSGRYAKPDKDGMRNLTKPQLSKTKDGTRQLSDAYNRPRLEQVIAFSEEFRQGEGPRAQVTKIDLKLMMYQSWEVDASGKIGEVVGPPQDCSVEVAMALVQVAHDRGMELTR